MVLGEWVWQISLSLSSPVVNGSLSDCQKSEAVRNPVSESPTRGKTFGQVLEISPEISPRGHVSALAAGLGPTSVEPRALAAMHGQLVRPPLPPLDYSRAANLIGFIVVPDTRFPCGLRS